MSNPERVRADQVTALAEAEPEIRRLARLFRATPGVWAVAVCENAAMRQAFIEQLRAELASLPLIERSLLDCSPDLLAILRDIPADPPPVVSFTGLSSALEQGMSNYLELQRDALLAQPHRLLFWVTAYELEVLSKRAPNFYSRINTIAHFPGQLVDPSIITSNGRISIGDISGRDIIQSPPPAYDTNPRRPPVEVTDDRERARWIAYYQRRIADLEQDEHPDATSIADAWYDLAGLYAREPADLQRASESYERAAEWYARAGQRGSQAEAL